MLKTETALAKLRELCASLPDTSERPHFGESIFYVGRKGFASCGSKDGVGRFVFELDPERTDHLLRTDPRFERYPFAKKALVLRAGDAKSWGEVKALVLESYRLAAERGRPAKPAASRRTRPTRPPGDA